MSLIVGTRLGAYEITALLGAGGMGLVYRARDTKLNRDVAIKVLPPLFAADADRIARFTREAQTLAALNHANIAAIYGIEEFTGSLALVMEMVEGEDLSVHIARGPMPIADAVAIARQLADALEAAHEQGIVHRDLKPANLKITPDGKVKVLDFGLAKAFDSARTAAHASTDPGLHRQDAAPYATTSPAMTTAGVVLGTAAYMAPEQARGRPVDKRADIWAFGVVCFEMLTGVRLFQGDTVSDTLAAVLRQDIDWTLLPPATPAAVGRTLRRCLERDPRERLRDIGDADFVIDDADDRPAARQRPTPLWKIVLPWAAAVVGMLAVWIATRPAPAPPAETVRAALDLPEGLVLPERDRALALSPDGRQLAVVLTDRKTSRSQIYLRTLGKLEWRALPGTEGATYPCWSPNGRAIAFFAADELRRLDLPDGPVRTVADATAGRGISWGAGDQMVFAATEPTNLDGVRLFTVGAAGNQARQPIGPALSAGQSYRVPHVLPNGAGILFERRDDQRKGEGIYVLAPGRTEATRLLDVSSEAQYVPPGYLAFVRDGLAMIQAFDLRTLTLSGQAEVVADRVHWDLLRATGHIAFPAASNGAFVYQRTPPNPIRQLTWFDRDGKPLGTVGEAAEFDEVSTSPDGTRAIVVIASQLWLVDTARGVRSAFYSAAGQRGDTVAWSPDGRRVAFRDISNGGRLAVRAVDAPVASQILIGNVGENWAPSAWLPDNASVLVDVYRGVKGEDLGLVAADGKGETKFLMDTTAQESSGEISPDGKWLAFVSSESGQSQAYVTAYPALGRKWPVTSGGARTIQWSTSAELVYLDSAGAVIVVPFRSTAGGPVLGAPHPLLGGKPMPGPGSPTGAVTRFLIAMPFGAQDTRSPLVLVQNWLGAIGK